MKVDGLHENEQGTRMFFGKPYHWQKDGDGRLHLLAGKSPHEVEPERVRLTAPGAEVGDTIVMGSGVRGVVMEVAEDGALVEMEPA